MLKFYQFPGPWDVCSASPFCAKLEAFMRWQDIPYQSVTVTNMKGAPKGKIPYIVDDNGPDGNIVLGDSNFIIEYLIKRHGLHPDDGLTLEQKATARAFHYLCEDSLYWAMVYFRWVDLQGHAVMKQVVFSKVPALIRPLIKWRVMKFVHKQLYMQGTGRHSREEIVHIACNDLQVLSDFLGKKAYCFGDNISSMDLTVFSVVANFITGPFDNPVTRYAKTLDNLVAHAERVRGRCFSGMAGRESRQAA